MQSMTDLAAGLHAGELSQESLDELRELLLSDASAVDAFVMESFLLSQLGEQLGDARIRESVLTQVRVEAEDVEVADSGVKQGVTASGESDIHVARSSSWLQWASRHPLRPAIAVAIVTVAAALFVLAVIPASKFLAYDKQQDEKQHNATTVAAKEIATLTRWYQTDWVKDKRLSGKNHRITAGQTIAFRSGVAEITYDIGTKVIIEGPAEYVVGGTTERGVNSGALKLGKLVAAVPMKAKGFRVDTPSGRIEDLGTEFGVAVDAAGTTNTHVFQGKISLRPRSAAGELEKRQLLTQGMSKQIDAAGRVIAHVADTQFIRNAEADELFSGKTLTMVSYEYVGEYSDPQKARAVQVGYFDDDRKKLTDGVVGSTNHADGAWVGWQDRSVDSRKPQPAVVFDLGGVAVVRTVQVAYLVQQRSGIHPPDRVIVSASEDGQTYTQVADQSNFDDTGGDANLAGGRPRSIEIDLGNQKARYVRLKFYSDEQWTFLSEVRFIAAENSSDD